MTKKLLAVATLAALLAVACSRSSGGAASATPLQIYTAGPTITQVRSTLGDRLWWLGPPSFGVRPLDLESTPEAVRFSITQRYVHIGTGDTFSVRYVVYASASDATTFMTNLKSSLGTNVATTPKAGDQVIYTGQRLPGNTALYETAALVRLGQIVIVADLMQGSGFVDSKHLGEIANMLVGRVKDVLANKLRPSAITSTDQGLLPPPGTDITLVGVARLPVETVANMLNSGSPQDITSTFTTLGVNDFVYGDYALDADLHMEVRAAAFTFSSVSDASAWLDVVIGKSSLNANGVFFTYIDALKQYIAVFAGGPHVALLLCKSTLDTEAASRACEVPMSRVALAWEASLSR